MNPIKDLIREHDSIKSMLQVLGKMSDKLAAGEPVPAEDLKSGVVFLEEFGDKCHHRKEESYLFPMMEKSGDPEVAGLGDELANEHGMAREHVKSMTEALEKQEEDLQELAKVFNPHVKELSPMMELHINKEEKVLFPAAEKSLSEDQMKELEEGFRHVESDIIGTERHEELEAMLRKLETDYLGK